MAANFSDEDVVRITSLLNSMPQSPSTASVPPQPIPAKQPAKRKTKPFRLRDIVPDWGYEAAAWMNQQRESGTVVISGLISVSIFLIGGFMLFGDGYTSIQGVRIPLEMLGFSVKTTGIPFVWWWMLPLAMTLFEIFGKRIPGLKPFWIPVIFFDGMTTALYVTTGIGRFLASAGHTLLLPSTFWQLFSWDIMQGIVIVALISGAVGLALAVLAEQVFLSSLVMIRGTIFRKR